MAALIDDVVFVEVTGVATSGRRNVAHASVLETYAGKSHPGDEVMLGASEVTVGERAIAVLARDPSGIASVVAGTLFSERGDQLALRCPLGAEILIPMTPADLGRDLSERLDLPASD